MKVGLRTEVVVSIILLLGAALLFSGFLLVKLTEKGLLDQQRSDLRRTVTLLGSAVSERVVRQADYSSRLARLQPMLTALGRHEDVSAWQLLGQDQQVLAAMSTAGPIQFSEVGPATLSFGEVSETLSYSSAWNPLTTKEPSYLDLAVPIGSDEVLAVLQVRFSLATLEARVHGAQKLVLFYALMFGGVLSIFGVFTLNRNIVRPVRKLQQATTNVAQGALQSIAVPAGPEEIRELADSFNRMVRALSESRAETEAHITSLEEANRALSEAQEDLLRAEKMASVGHLSAGMAHEIGNPLGAIVGYLDLLRQDVTEPGSRELVERSLAEANRIDALIRELLDYATPGTVATEIFDPVATCRETVEMAIHQGVLGNIQVIDKLPATASAICMNRGQFAQVCINLLLNARDAMSEGGALTLSMKQVGDFLGCNVADQGCGMDAATLKAIFEPFFTTKDPGKGTGLGLSVCQRIVDQAGGRIEVTSEVGSGSSFTVWLPIATGTSV